MDNRWEERRGEDPRPQGRRWPLPQTFDEAGERDQWEQLLRGGSHLQAVPQAGDRQGRRQHPQGLFL